jgi:methylenetetrahydrofolate--tRNA-(uracil-5-)-methyltransferase
VGCQTNLTFAEQKRVFGLVPALRGAEFVRYGVMHRNTFISSPKLLQATYAMQQDEKIFFAGQITGVEGYMESTSSGLVAGINAARLYKGETPVVFPRETMIGALSLHASGSQSKDFQPMGANFGIIPSLEEKIRDKRERYAKLAERSLKLLDEMKFLI